MSPERLNETPIECGFCQKSYRPSDSSDSFCSSCPSSRNSCGKARCPHCFYDNPLPLPRTSWLARLLGRRGKS